MTASVTDDIAADMAARNEGQAAVQAADVAVHRSNGTYIRQALAAWIELGYDFDCDDIRRTAENRAKTDGHHFDPHPNLFGSVIGTAARSGLIVPVGEANSGRPTRNASRNAIWTATDSRLGMSQPGTTSATNPTP